MRKRMIVLTALLMTGIATAQDHAPWPGGIGIVPITGDVRPTVKLDDRPVMVINDGGTLSLIHI